MLPANFEKMSLPLPAGRAGRWIAGSSLFVLLLIAALLWWPRNVLLPAPWMETADVRWLPWFNAGLNSASALFLVAAYLFIRRRNVQRHRFCMLTATALSALFLVSYLIYHTIAGPTRFTGEGWIRPFYLAVLLSHMVLAALLLPLALTTLYHAWQGAFRLHRRIARWALPVWLYVSVSGVVVFLWLYYWN